jgi:hypothetical protein
VNSPLLRTRELSRHPISSKLQHPGPIMLPPYNYEINLGLRYLPRLAYFHSLSLGESEELRYAREGRVSLEISHRIIQAKPYCLLSDLPTSPPDLLTSSPPPSPLLFPHASLDCHSKPGNCLLTKLSLALSISIARSLKRCRFLLELLPSPGLSLPTSSTSSSLPFLLPAEM